MSQPSSPAAVYNTRVQVRHRSSNASSPQRPNSTSAAGAGGSSSTMLRLYTDDAPGLTVDPVFVLVLSLGFIGSVFALHILAKIMHKFAS
ncbi:uncharacterized protein T551_00378 [Pneumocystis jirovecii RU7]|uniref:Protein transport protein Sec61 subunit beta n=1 Tax=Pneumocystis jirovecii (strain RU7) TaxID=1408657 RepID=A0A0W4ZV94_PNEJ7|nr:uncharacterized protein T551_00378 [Pneumocystis jirovecii RU7]KTW32287.1 hypothetical protein T551_00378 [Pneumocystis jirovecii RU7]